MSTATPGRRLGLAATAVATVATVAVLVVVLAGPAFADAASGPSLNTVIDNLRNWLVGILAGVATLFLTVGGLRYLAAGGDPSQVEKAKVALRSAAVGYALAILAPLLVSILASVVGSG
ncbi:MAG TPA: pilin [Acidimicrobiales bacterium]|nr:pilin [Acidimicrobiales bacterium]